ncbi:hypothetical protein [Shewanella khirikhana]|uniref:Uncharacterized protein n=1 Tax=Shewanella khirikhana TaxID=1965282 RepID=A0ABM7DT88_9GAMM|nr:hypothetical protein [Shewanella khirikhana]AZQ12927.1 hypothetical protein STH12_03875 [Shewanella khirikhana]
MKKELTLSILMLALVACGGGSDGGTDSGGNSNGSPSVPSTPKLKLSTITAAQQCGLEEARAGVTVIAHRNDGTILSQTTSDTSGLVEIEWPTEAKHLTVGDISDYSDEMTLYTDMNLPAGDAGKYWFYESYMDDQCNCKTVYLDYAGIQQAYPAYDIYVNGFRVRSTSNVWNEQLCEGGRQTLRVTLAPQIAGNPAFALKKAFSELTDEQYIILEASSFSSADNQSELVTVTSNLTNPRHYGSALVDGTLRGQGYWAAPDAHFFPALFDRQQLTVSESELLEETAEASLYYGKGRRIAVSDFTSSLDVNVPHNQQLVLSEFYRMLEGMNNATSVNYDFSSFSEGKQAMNISLVEFLVVSWNVTGPLSGTLPDFKIPDAFQAKLDSLDKADLFFRLSGYEPDWSYADYTKAIVELQKAQTFPVNLDDYIYETITIRAK